MHSSHSRTDIIIDMDFDQLMSWLDTKIKSIVYIASKNGKYKKPKK